MISPSKYVFREEFLMSKRKLPSQRNMTQHIDVRLRRLYTPLGIPVPTVPAKYKKDPDAYWKLMHERVERSILMIKQLNAALDLLEETSPDFAKQLPWYENRKRWKESGGELDEDSLRIELLVHHQKDMNFEVFKNFDFKSTNTCDPVQVRELMRRLRAKRKEEKLANK